MQHFTVTIEGPGWKDVDDIELPGLPGEGDRIETRYGTCLVVRAELIPDDERYDGQIVCRMP